MGDESRRAHLEMIQAVIVRMASNSFQLKGWTVVLVSGLFALAAADVENMAIIALVPTLVFWVLDSYYLRQERLFRKLYDHTRTTPETDIDYSMNTTPFTAQVQPVWQTTLTVSTAGFYAPLAAVTVIVGIAVA